MGRKNDDADLRDAARILKTVWNHTLGDPILQLEKALANSDDLIGHHDLRLGGIEERLRRIESLMLTIQDRISKAEVAIDDLIVLRREGR